MSEAVGIIGLLGGLFIGVLVSLPVGLFVGYRWGYNVQWQVIGIYQKELYSRKLKTDAELDYFEGVSVLGDDE